MSKKKKPLVSIIVPVYNVELYLEKCVQSLLSQTYGYLEIILVDDGSTDASGTLCDRLSQQHANIHVLHQQNKGASAARNAGLEMVKGEFVGFVDSDDYLEPEAMELLVGTALQYHCKIAQMKSYIVDSDYHIVANESGNTRNIKVISSEEYVKGMCEKCLSESVCDKLFSAELFENRRFKEEVQNEDFYFLSELLFEDTSIVQIDYSGYNYYQRPGSVTKSGFGKAILDSVKNAYELKKLAEAYKLLLVPYFARLVLFQSKVVFTIIPWSYVANNSPEYTKTLAYMTDSLPYLKKTTLKKTDKLILQLIHLFPKLTVFCLSSLWKVFK